MAIDPNQLMSLGQAQGQLEQRYSDYLRQKRDLQGVRDTAAQRFEGSFGPQGETGAVVNPADIFSSFKTFQTAIPSQAEQLQTESDVLNQIAQLAQARQPAGVSLADQIKAFEAGLDIVDGQLVPRATTGSLSEKQRKDLLDERATLLEQGLDTSSIDEQLRSVGILKDTGEREDIVALIDEILASDKNLKALTGDLRLGGIPLINRSKVATTRAKLDQLQGYLTLENRQKLRGQGTITDKEQKTLEQAASTLGERGQSTENYIQELQKLRKELSQGISTNKQPENGGQEDPLGIL